MPEFCTGSSGVSAEEVQPVDVELSVQDRVQAARPTVSGPVGQDPADEVARHQPERRLGHRIEDREPGPLVELDSAGRVGRVTRKVGTSAGAEDLLGVAQVERFEDVRERWVTHVMQQPDGAEG